MSAENYQLVVAGLNIEQIEPRIQTNILRNPCSPIQRSECRMRARQLIREHEKVVAGSEVNLIGRRHDESALSIETVRVVYSDGSLSLIVHEQDTNQSSRAHRLRTNATSLPAPKSRVR